MSEVVHLVIAIKKNRSLSSRVNQGITTQMLEVTMLQLLLGHQSKRTLWAFLLPSKKLPLDMDPKALLLSNRKNLMRSLISTFTNKIDKTTPEPLLKETRWVSIPRKLITRPILKTRKTWHMIPTRTSMMINTTTVNQLIWIILIEPRRLSPNPKWVNQDHSMKLTNNIISILDLTTWMIATVP